MRNLQTLSNLLKVKQIVKDEELEPRQSDSRTTMLSHYPVLHRLRPELADLLRNEREKYDTVALK